MLYYYILNYPTFVFSMKYTIEEASALVNKSPKSMYRHMAQSGLRYSFDSDNRRVVLASELESFYKVKIDATVSDSQMRILNENENENPLLDTLIEQISFLTQEVKRLSDNQSKLLNNISQKPLETVSSTPITEPIKGRPEDDPDWPKEVKTAGDITRRKNIRDKYR